jgi:hypothetical protein
MLHPNQNRLKEIAKELEKLGYLVAADAAHRASNNNSTAIAVQFHETILRVKLQQLKEYGKVFKSYYR